MKEHDGTEQDFARLRRRGIEAAQETSRDHWTDYNLHDPGVTLLEQTCFSLTEVSFRAQHTVPDLLTDAEDQLDYDALGLFLPGRNLPGDPLTLLDLSTELAEHEDIARALLAPGARAGLIDVTVIPSKSLDENDKDEAARWESAEKAVRSRFAENRPLGCDLGEVRAARMQPKRLQGTVRISATATPEKVAAEVYFRVAAILRGVPVGSELTKGATREMVFAEPETYLHAPSDQDDKLPRLENHLHALRDIPGLLDLSDLDIVDLVPPAPAPADEKNDARLTFGDLKLPATSGERQLVLEVSGVPVALDVGRIGEEHFRISAEAIARAHHHIDAEDWKKPLPGQRRSFAHDPVDSTLPAIYATAARRARSGDAFTHYRAMTNAHLEGMNRDLADLPELLRQREGPAPTDPAARRRRIEVLDYQLALQGEEMPATAHTGLHTYRSTAERQAFDVEWRQAFLAQVPELNKARGLGPDAAQNTGFMAKFLLLADLKPARFPKRPLTLKRLKLEFGTLAPRPAPDFSGWDVRVPDDPYDLLLTRQPATRVLGAGDLRSALPWLAADEVCPDMLRRLADPANFVVSRAPEVRTSDDESTVDDPRYLVLFDSGAGCGLHRCGTFSSHDEARQMVYALRAKWVELQEQAEGAVLIEDILLRDEPTHFTANLAYMVLPGWTARMSQKPYQAYVNALIDRLAPAQMHIRPLWLDFAAHRQFADLYAPYVAGEKAAAQSLRSMLIEQAARHV